MPTESVSVDLDPLSVNLEPHSLNHANTSSLAFFKLLHDLSYIWSSYLRVHFQASLHWSILT